MTLGNPILQFGTSRFLQAHVDLFVSEALAVGKALGGITVVQTTSSSVSSARTAALAQAPHYPVRIRGLQDGQPVDETRHCSAIKAALHADADWALLRKEVASGDVQVIVSNTGDSGWRLDAADGPIGLAADAAAPRSFPAKLLVLLHDRWHACPTAFLSVLPCELVSRNGTALCSLVSDLARRWALPAGFVEYLEAHVRWANSLVDRIVSEALDPVGAVAEPYALWAIERQDGLVLPCEHAAIVLTDELGHHERLKLYLLNLGHSMLAEHWLTGHGDAARTVVQAMSDGASRFELETVWTEEVLPVLDALGERDAAEGYLASLRERLLNPFLAHRLADIAQHHTQKKMRRIAPVVAMAERMRPGLAQPRLRAALMSAA